jgi:hypothetical protein
MNSTTTTRTATTAVVATNKKVNSAANSNDNNILRRHLFFLRMDIQDVVIYPYTDVRTGDCTNNIPNYPEGHTEPDTGGISKRRIDEITISSSKFLSSDRYDMQLELEQDDILEEYLNFKRPRYNEDDNKDDDDDDDNDDDSINNNTADDDGLECSQENSSINNNNEESFEALEDQLAKTMIIIDTPTNINFDDCSTNLLNRNISNNINGSTNKVQTINNSGCTSFMRDDDDINDVPDNDESSSDSSTPSFFDGDRPDNTSQVPLNEDHPNQYDYEQQNQSQSNRTDVPTRLEIPCRSIQRPIQKCIPVISGINHSYTIENKYCSSICHTNDNSSKYQNTHKEFHPWKVEQITQMSDNKFNNIISTTTTKKQEHTVLDSNSAAIMNGKTETNFEHNNNNWNFHPNETFSLTEETRQQPVSSFDINFYHHHQDSTNCNKSSNQIYIRRHQGQQNNVRRKNSLRSFKR